MSIWQRRKRNTFLFGRRGEPYQTIDEFLIATLFLAVGSREWSVGNC